MKILTSRQKKKIKQKIVRNFAKTQNELLLKRMFESNLYYTVCVMNLLRIIIEWDVVLFVLSFFWINNDAITQSTLNSLLIIK